MAKVNTTKKRKRRSSSSSSKIVIPELYKEDIGIEGIKTKNVKTTHYRPVTGIHNSMKLTKDDITKIKQRKSRFGNDIAKNESLDLPNEKNFVLSGSTLPHYEQFIGTNMNIEKDYLRLTTYPRKEDVRPYEVLIRSLLHIKSKYIEEEDFDWVNNQLKSVRQDIVCQNIRNKFVLDVYETHARILLENGDLNEFNQCQTMIRSLTEKRTNAGEIINEEQIGKNLFTTESIIRDNHRNNNELILQQSKESMLEFRSYALLYALVRNSRLELVRELDQMNDLLLTPANIVNDHSGSESLSSCCCQHALQVVQAVEEFNYRTFFVLYESAPNMSAYLMDFLVKRVRDQAYERIIASYRPHVSVENIREWLHFDDLEETRRFLRQRSTIFLEVKGEAPFWIDCKASK